MIDEISKLEQRCKRCKDFVPSEFRKPLQLSRLSNPYAVRRVMGWHAIPPAELDEDGNPTDAFHEALGKILETGLIAFGPPRGKTRSIYARLIQLAAEDEPFVALKTSDLLTAITKLAKNRDASGVVSVLENWKYCENLFLDGFDSMKFNEPFAEEMFKLIEYRTDTGNPMLVTSSTAGDELIAKVSGRSRYISELTEAMVRRLGDNCDVVDFDYNPQSELALHEVAINT